MNKLIEVKNARISLGDNFIKNINLDFIENENVNIYSNDHNSLALCNLLINSLIDSTKLETGEINYKNNYKYHYILQINKLIKELLNQPISIETVLNKLFVKQQFNQTQKQEILDLVHLFSLDNINEKISNLNQVQKELLTLVLFLVFKPKLIFIRKISFFENDSPLLIAICSYLKTYLNKNEIAIITCINNQNVAKHLCDRFIEIKNNVIHADNRLVVKSEMNKNIVDNKTKIFDLDNELLNLDEALSEDFDFSNQINNQKDVMNEFSESLIKQTARLDNLNNFNNDFENTSKSFNPIKDSFEPKITNKFNSTNNYTSNDFEDDEYYVSPIPKANKTTSLTGFSSLQKQEEDLIHSKTRELRFDNEDLMEEIKLSKKTAPLSSNVNKTSSLIINQNDFDVNEINDNDSNEVRKDLIDTYNILYQLEQQIKSPEFIELPNELQERVFDNYDRAKELIKSHDPNGKYDPNQTSNLKLFNDDDDDTTNQIDMSSGFTKRILTEELKLIDNEDTNFNQTNKDKRIENIYSSKTSNVDLDEYETFSDEDELDNDTNFNFTKVSTQTNYQQQAKPTEIIKTRSINTRNKRNKIEKIYAEAVADEKLIKDNFDE